MPPICTCAESFHDNSIPILKLNHLITSKKRVCRNEMVSKLIIIIIICTFSNFLMSVTLSTYVHAHFEITSSPKLSQNYSARNKNIYIYNTSLHMINNLSNGSDSYKIQVRSKERDQLGGRQPQQEGELVKTHVQRCCS